MFPIIHKFIKNNICLNNYKQFSRQALKKKN